MREQNIVMSTTQIMGGCSLETQRDTTNKHEARTKLMDEKRDTQLLWRESEFSTQSTHANW
jgi:hypothetical protein